MEPVKKRRNSILKKKSAADEDTTTEIKARRISFSGKKSIKEFIAGVEAETIWGTSYEESADDLKVSCSESGLVNVHVKRIQLRNRRVVCDPQQQKRRSSSKKKVFVAENDKENLCIKANSSSLTLPSPLPPVNPIEQLQSPVKSELALTTNSEQNITKCQEIMPPKKLVMRRSSICSNTFDFINCSDQINKTITIEHSLDVTLDDSELRMYKFRVPVTSTEMNPHTSTALCRSMVMSEEDVNVLKVVCKQTKGQVNVIKEQLNDKDVIEMKEPDGVSDMSVEKIGATIVEEEVDVRNISNQMEISHDLNLKGSKRKSERTAHLILPDSSLVETDSPMRKKPMHTLDCSSIDITNNLGNPPQEESIRKSTNFDLVDVDESISHNKPSGRQTIHFESIVLEESAAGIKTLSQTIFDSKTINETSSFPNTTVSCLAMGNYTDEISMELAISVPIIQEITQTNSQTILFSPDKQNEKFVGKERQNIEETQPLSVVKKSETVYGSSDNEEINMPISLLTKSIGKQRDTVHTPILMDEESVNPSTALKENKSTENTTSNSLRNKRETTYETVDIEVDNEMILKKNKKASGAMQSNVLESNQSVIIPENVVEEPSIKEIENRNLLQKTIKTPVKIFDDEALEVEPVGINRKSIYVAVDIEEDNASVQHNVAINEFKKGINASTASLEQSKRTQILPNSNVKSQTTYNQVDISIDTNTAVDLEVEEDKKCHKTIDKATNIVEEIPAGTTQRKPSRIQVFRRESSSTDLSAKKALQLQIKQPEVQNSTNVPKFSFAYHQTNLKKRLSVHTPVDMIEDSPKTTKTTMVSRPIDEKRKTVYEPCNILVDSPSSNIEKSRQMVEESPKTKVRSTNVQPQVNINELELEKRNDMSIRKPTKHLAEKFKLLENPVSSTQKIMDKVMQEMGYSMNFQIEFPSETTSKEVLPSVPGEDLHLSMDLSVDQSIQKELELEYKTEELLLLPKKNLKDISDDMSIHNSFKQMGEEDNFNSQASQAIEIVSESFSNHKMEIPSDDKQIGTSRPLSRRETIHFNQDLEIEDIDEHNEPTPALKMSYKDQGGTVLQSGAASQISGHQKTAAQVSGAMPSQSNHKTIHCYEDLQVEPNNENTSQHKSKSKTIHLNEDLELEDVSIKPIPQRLKHQTMNFNENIVDKVLSHKPLVHTKILPDRRTILMNQDLDLCEVDDSKNAPSDPNNTHLVDKSREVGRHVTQQRLPNRQIIYLDEGLKVSEIDHLQDVTQRNRRQDSIKVIQETKQEIVVPPKLAESSAGRRANRQTIHVSQDIDISAIHQISPVVESKRQVKLSNKELDVNEIVTDKFNRKTIQLQQDLDLTESDDGLDISSQEFVKTNRETKYLNQDLDVGKPPETSYQIIRSHRQTINIPQDIDTSQINCNSQLLHENSPQDSFKSFRQIKQLNQKLDVSESEAIGTLIVPVRQTIHLHQDLDITEADERLQELSPESIAFNRGKNNLNHDLNVNGCQESRTQIVQQEPYRKTMHLNQDLDVTQTDSQGHVPFQKTMKSQAFSQKPNRKTMHLNQDLDVTQAEPSQVYISPQETINARAISQKVNRQTMHLNQDLDVTQSDGQVQIRSQETINSRAISQKHNRQTMHLNQDLDETQTDSQVHISPQETINARAISQKVNRQTMHLNQDLDVTQLDGQVQIRSQETIKSRAISQKHNRQTMHLNQDLDVTQTDSHVHIFPQETINARAISQKVNRQTMHLNQDLDVTQPNGEVHIHPEETINSRAISQKHNRQTMHFNEDFDVTQTDSQLHISPQETINARAISQKVNRQTMHLNQDLDVTQPNGEVNIRLEETINSRAISKKLNRQTMHLNQDLDVTQTDIQIHFPSQETIDSRPTSRKLSRQTLHLNQDLDVTQPNGEVHIHPEETINSRAISQKHNRQTMHFNQDLDVTQTDRQVHISPQETINARAISQKVNRQTMHLNQDLDVTQLDGQVQIRSQETINSGAISQKHNRQTMHLNQDLDVTQTDSHVHIFPQETINARAISQKVNRQTMHLNQDLDVTQPNGEVHIHPEKTINSRAISQKHNRQTMHLNQDLDVTQPNGQVQIRSQETINSRAISQKHNRQTLHLNEDLDVTQPDGEVHIRPEETINSRAVVNQELEMSIESENKLIPSEFRNHEQSSNVGRRQTVYYQQEIEIDDEDLTTQNSIDKHQLSIIPKRNKVLSQQEIELNDESCKQERNKLVFVDDSTMNPEMAMNICLPEKVAAASNKFVSKPKRVTIFDPQPLDMDESILPKSTGRKSSFSRTLNFDEVPPVKTDMPHQNSTNVTKLKVAWHPSSKDDHSPTFNPNLRPKLPMTPEVDRSLAEYLKMEAAIEEEEEEEEVFYDAEDGTGNEKLNKRQTCHVPVNIMEESGMQPLDSYALKRQTTFSPKQITNESFQDGNSNLRIGEMNTGGLLEHNERCNRLQKHTSKQFFPKCMDSDNITTVNERQNTTMDHEQIPYDEPHVESDFYSNAMKQVVQRPIHRQTVYFNEPINFADISSTWKPSSAVQSVKELLQENTRLFAQSNLENPSALENKRSTLFFTEKDNSLDVICIDDGPADIESTPTKNKISRIPQLIGSAKKLESLKKSMEFIQQELPNIGLHRKSRSIDDSSRINPETPRRLSISKPKRLQELDESLSINELLQKPTEESLEKLTRPLNETFDTIEIPRKVLSCIRKTVEVSPRRDPENEPCDIDEVPPRKVTDIYPSALQESFDTVEIPRRATTFQRNDTLYICQNEKETTVDASQKSLFQFEEPPITISDVSTFFTKKRLTTAEQTSPTYSPNTTEALCKFNVNESQAISCSPDSEDVTHNLAHFKKRYVELTCDSIALSDSRDYIEKTHLSLVNTIDDESEMLQSPVKIIQVPPEVSLPTIKEEQTTSKSNSSVCRNCKCKRMSLAQNDTTIGSFILEPLPVYKVDLSELEQLAKKPSIADVGKVWRQKLRESDSFNVSDGSRSMAIDDEDSESIEKFSMELAEKRSANIKKIQEMRKELTTENSFVCKVRRKMQSESNWLINDLLLFNNVIVLTHTRIRTFAIVIHFTPKDPRGVEVIFNDVQIKPNMLHTRQWKPFEYALHYQLLVELPFDLKNICSTSEQFFDLLEHVGKVIEDVFRTGKEMLSLILSSPASLIREPSGRLYIRKYVRTKSPQNDVKRTEIHIEVRNIKKLSYESIVMPPLYEFDEQIQLLPVGNDFLREFLNDPLKFIKT